MRNLIKIHKALSDPNRLRILKMLQQRSLCVCEMTSILNLATSTVSKHLALLRDAGLIIDSKEGKWVNFQLNDNPDAQYVKDILGQLKMWLNDDLIILKDAAAVGEADRYTLCSTEPDIP